MLKQKRSLILYPFAALVLISGAAGLIYQIVWERLLELYFGVTMISITLIVSAFMAGLGIGSLIGGRIARNLQNALLLYGLLEIGIALFGVVSPRVIVWIGEATAGSPYALVFLISFAILLIPTTLMGMTLPLLTQSFVDRVETAGQVIGLLYGINTLGAALGAVLGGYVLIGFYGFEGAIYRAVFLNAAVGLFAVWLSRRQMALATGPVDGVTASGGSVLWGYGSILVSSFLVGFIGLGFEMLWIRLLSLVNKNTAYSFPSVLGVFLFGLAIGGYFWGRRADTSRNPVALFCKVELAGAAVAAFTFLVFQWSLQFNPPWIQAFFETRQPISMFVESGNEFYFSRRVLLWSLWDYFLPILILVLPATLILGGGLPLLDRISIQSPLLSGRRVGDIHLANIVGSVAGALVISFILLPAVGSEWTLKLLILTTFVFPALYLLNRTQHSQKRSVDRNDLSLVGPGLVALLSVFLLPDRGAFYRHMFMVGSGQEVIVSESGDSVLALTYDPASERDDPAGWFWIGGEINSFFPAVGLYEERALVCAGAAQPQRILVIGFGGGHSTMFYKSIIAVEQIVVVELLGDIAPFLSRNVASARTTLSDPRITYVVDDGRRYLNAFPDEKFDLISIDPLRQHTAGHNNMYSEEALKIYRSHLAPGGVLCAWMDDFHTMPHTVARVFPYVDQFRNEFMVASDQVIVYDKGYMTQLVEDYASLTSEIYGEDRSIRLDVSRALNFFKRDQEQILDSEQSRNILRDMNPVLEYYFFAVPASQNIDEIPEVVLKFESRIVE